MRTRAQPRPHGGAFLGSFQLRSREVVMEIFVHQQNLMLLRKQLAMVANEARQLQLLRLLAEEEAKDQQSPKGRHG